MPVQNHIAIVLKQTKLAEKDLIIHALTDAGSSVQVVAKGARRPGSKLTALIEPGNIITGAFYFPNNYKQSQLGILQQASFFETFGDVHSNTTKLASLGVVLELVDIATRDGEPEPRLFAMLKSYLAVLDEAKPDRIILLTASAVLKIASQIGFRPNLYNCTECGQVLFDPACHSCDFSELRQHANFYFAQGGLLCDDCTSRLSEQLESQLKAPTALVNETLLLEFNRINQLKHDSPLVKGTQQVLKFSKNWIEAQIPGHIKAWRVLEQVK